MLRCDSEEEGVSELVSPRGDVGVLAHNQGSWEFGLDAEQAKGGNWFGSSSFWGKQRLGSEFAVWCWVLFTLVLIELLGSVRRSHLEWVWDRVRRGWGWVRESEERLIEIEQEEGQEGEGERV